MGNGPPIKKSHFFRKEKNGHTQEKKNNGQKMGTLKKNVIRKKNCLKK